VEFDDFTVDDLKKDEKTGEVIDLAIEEDEVQTRGQGILGNLSTLGSVESGPIGMSTPLTKGGIWGEALPGGFQPLMAQGGLATFAHGGEGQSEKPFALVDMIQQALVASKGGADTEDILRSFSVNEAAKRILPPNLSLTRDPYGQYDLGFSKDIGEDSRVEFILSHDEEDRPEARVEFSTNPEKLLTSILSKIVDRKASGGLASFQYGGNVYGGSASGGGSRYGPRETITVPTKIKDQAAIYQYVPSERERLYTDIASQRADIMGLGRPSGSVLTAADPLSIEWNMAPQQMTGMEYANYPTDYGYEEPYYGYGGGRRGGGGGGLMELFASFMQDRPSREGRRRQRREEKQATKDDDQRRQLLQMIGSIYGAPQDVPATPVISIPDYGDYEDEYRGGYDPREDFDFWPDEYQRAGGSAPGGEIAYPRMNGAISGAGSETSDNIPAMLSDGEFVTNAEALRGIGLLAGANKQDKEEQRMVGARKMYDQQREAQKFAEDLLG